MKSALGIAITIAAVMAGGLAVCKAMGIDSHLRELRELRTPRVVLNLKAVRYIDSSGVASLVEGLKAARDVGARFILFGLNTTVREVLQLSKLVRIFEICESEEQAVAT